MKSKEGPEQCKLRDSRRGKVGACRTRGRGFESSHQSKFIYLRTLLKRRK